MARTPEGKVKDDIDKWIEANMPGRWRYAPPGGAFGVAGTSDRMYLWRGVFFAVEVKKNHDNPATPLQLSRIRKIVAAGGIGAVMYGFQVGKLEAIRELIVKRTPEWVDGPAASTV